MNIVSLASMPLSTRETQDMVFLATVAGGISFATSNILGVRGAVWLTLPSYLITRHDQLTILNPNLPYHIKSMILFTNLITHVVVIDLVCKTFEAKLEDAESLIGPTFVVFLVASKIFDRNR